MSKLEIKFFDCLIGVESGGTNMNAFIDRLFQRFYWFYERVVKEEDENLRFYFAAFAISFILFFYLNFILALLYYLTQWPILRFERTKYTILTFLFVGVLVYSFFKNKDHYMTVVDSKEKSSFNKIDILVLLYFACGLFLSFYTFHFLKVFVGGQF